MSSHLATCLYFVCINSFIHQSDECFVHVRSIASWQRCSAKRTVVDRGRLIVSMVAPITQDFTTAWLECVGSVVQCQTTHAIFLPRRRRRCNSSSSMIVLKKYSRTLALGPGTPSSSRNVFINQSSTSWSLIVDISTPPFTHLDSSFVELVFLG